MKLIDIAEVARRSGLPASTLRFYDEKGLIESVGRRGLRRLYEVSVLERLSLIALGRNAGFSLEEIDAMFAPDGHPRIDRAQLVAKADEIDRTIKKLTALRDGLLHAAECPAPSHLECPTFQRMLHLASAEQARKRRKQMGLPGELSPLRQETRRKRTGSSTGRAGRSDR
ncbi:helix-turn-helix domain-containing protein (plasmid) [Phyllobacteriaceae bacterium JZ32]